MLSRLLRLPWPPIDVLLVKTSHCPLCDKAHRYLLRSRRRLGLRIRVTDITGQEELLQRYGEEVPVVFINGKKRFMGRIDPVLLLRTVDAERSS